VPHRVEIIIHHNVIRDNVHPGVSSGLLFETTGLLQETIYEVQRRWLEELRQDSRLTAEIKKRTHNFDYFLNPITFTFEEVDRGSLRAKLLAGALTAVAAFGGAAAKDTIEDTRLYEALKGYTAQSLDSYTVDFRKTLEKRIEEMKAKENSVGIYNVELLDRLVKVSVNPKQMKHIESLDSILAAAA
jgi:hypothetical protein